MKFVLVKRLSKVLSKKCSYPIKVLWDREFNNYHVCNGKTGKLFFEIETGKKIDHKEIKKHISKAIKTRDMYRKDIDDNKYRVKRGRDKRKEYRRKLYKHFTEEIFDNAVCPKKSFLIQRGEKE